MQPPRMTQPLIEAQMLDTLNVMDWGPLVNRPIATWPGGDNVLDFHFK
jgi:hypothetical protein